MGVGCVAGARLSGNGEGGEREAGRNEVGIALLSKARSGLTSVRHTRFAVKNC